MAEIEKLNKTFQSEQVLGSDEMNSITSKIDESVDLINKVTEQVENKLELLVSGENISTINGTNILKSGNIDIRAFENLNEIDFDVSKIILGENPGTGLDGKLVNYIIYKFTNLGYIGICYADMTKKDVSIPSLVITQTAIMSKKGSFIIVGRDIDTFSMKIGNWYIIYNGLNDAPSDGNTYGRKDGMWSKTVGKVSSDSSDAGEIFNDYTNNIATGSYSHAEGIYTTAKGVYSHAEGNGSTASGQGSHAEGGNTTASGPYSHAEGVETIASRDGCHAEGYANEATADYAHAEGQNNKASGISSHVEGGGNIADVNFAHAEGTLNLSNNGSTDADKSLHTVGIGTSEEDRKNAHEIMLNGDHYIYGIGGYNGKNYSEAKTLQEVITELTAQIEALLTVVNETNR